MVLQQTSVGAQGTIEKAKTLFEAHKFDEATKLLTVVDEKSPDYAASRYYLGRIAFEQKKYDEAEEYIEEAIELNSKVADYHYWLGTVWGFMARESNVLKQGMLAPKIKSEYEETVLLDPKNMNAWWGLLSFYSEAPGFMGGSYDKALETATAIGKINAADGHRARGQVYNHQEKFMEAEKEYLAAYKLNPKLSATVVGFYLNTKQNDKAFELLEGALKKDSTNMAIIYQIGRTSAITGDRLDRGEQCLKKYLTHQPGQGEPSHGGAQMRLGQIYEKRGSKAEAKKAYQAAIKIDPTLKEAKEGLDRVSK
jgi:tetratricopeptide (TPR) repeat protein